MIFRMPLPKPEHGEDKSHFISRCIEFVMKENPDTPVDQAAAMCYTQWRNRNKTQKKNKQKKVLRKLMAKLEFYGEQKKEWDTFFDYSIKTEDGFLQLPRSTVIVGDGIYNGEYFPAEEIEKAFASMDGQPFNLDHSDKVEDEIGYILEPVYSRDTKKMSVIPILNLNTAKGKAALSFIENRRKAGKTAEVSVGVWVTISKERLNEDDEEEIPVCRDLEFDHLALVTRGACSPEHGAGIGLSDNPIIPSNFNVTFEEGINALSKITNEEIDISTDTNVYNGDNYTISTNGTWYDNIKKNDKEGDIVLKEELAKWDTKYINDLPDAAFAYIEPGGKKDEEGKTVPRSKRHLPHHNMNVKKGTEHDTVDIPHLRNALARLPQTKISEAAKKKARAHLIRHAKALGVGKYDEDEKPDTIKKEMEVDEKMAEEEVVEETTEEQPQEEEQTQPQEEETKVEEKKEDDNTIEQLKKEIEELKKQLAERKSLKKTEEKEDLEDKKTMLRKAGIEWLKKAAKQNVVLEWREN